jgi:hypothetical protein
MRAIIVGVALWTAISSTSAQASDIAGHGTSSCAEWTESQSDNFSALPNHAWLAGYLSGYLGDRGGDKIDIPDPAARNGWVTNYCRTHPLEKIWEAADQLILELKRRASRR